VKIEVENVAPLADFETLKHQHINNGTQFTTTSLARVPYEQLFLCCAGEAGAARCDRSLVVTERQGRRRRFLNMETDELEHAQRYLLINQMDEDVRTDTIHRLAPHWDDLNVRQQVWAKLNCIYNHIDNTDLRMKEAIILLRRCAEERLLPPEVAKSYMPRLRGLMTVFPGRVTDSIFRSKVLEIAESILEFLPDEEAAVMQREEIQGYSCSSDCYRVIV
jgi:hypothetical protein